MTKFLLEDDETEEEYTFEIDESQEDSHSYYAAGHWHFTDLAQSLLGEIDALEDVIGVYDKDGILHSDVGEYL